MSLNPKVTWYEARNPIVFSLTTEGALSIEYGVALPGGLPDVRFGIVIPAEKVKNLRNCLEETQTIQETLAAKPPTQSSH